MRKFLVRDQSVDYQAVFRQNSNWPDHMLRTEITADLISWMGPRTIIDPAAGDGSIVAAAHRRKPFDRIVLGDISTPNTEYLQDLRTSLAPSTSVVQGSALDILAGQAFRFNMVVLTEFLEHILAPIEVLRAAREKTDLLVASSPLWSRTDRDDPNVEHCWQFDEQGYFELLTEAGWTPQIFIPINFIGGYYNFQLWGAK